MRMIEMMLAIMISSVAVMIVVGFNYAQKHDKMRAEAVATHTTIEERASRACAPYEAKFVYAGRYNRRSSIINLDGTPTGNVMIKCVSTDGDVMKEKVIKDGP